MVICPHTDWEGAAEVAERLRQAIETFEFPTVGNQTASFGVAEILPGGDAKSVTARADKALYQSKEEGRNKVTAAPMKPLDVASD